MWAAGAAQHSWLEVAIGAFRGLLPCIIGGCDAVRLICPPVPGSVSNILRQAGLVLSHLVLYAAAAAEFLSRRGRLPGLVPLPVPAPLSVGLPAPHFGFPLVRSWDPRGRLPRVAECEWYGRVDIGADTHRLTPICWWWFPVVGHRRARSRTSSTTCGTSI